MAKRTKSGLKRLRQSIKRGQHNLAVRSRLKTVAKRVAGGAEAELKAALKAIDKAAAKGTIHKNTAARRKSRLTRRATASA